MKTVLCHRRVAYRAEARNSSRAPLIIGRFFFKKTDAEQDLEELRARHRTAFKVERYDALLLPDGRFAVVGVESIA